MQSEVCLLSHFLVPSFMYPACVHGEAMFSSQTFKGYMGIASFQLLLCVFLLFFLYFFKSYVIAPVARGPWHSLIHGVIIHYKSYNGIITLCIDPQPPFFSSISVFIGCNALRKKESIVQFAVMLRRAKTNWLTMSNYRKVVACLSVNNPTFSNFVQGERAHII